MSVSFQHYRDFLSTYLGPQRIRATLLAVLLLGTIGLELLNPQILRAFIDLATSHATLGALLRAALLFIGVALLNQMASVAVTYISEQLGWYATNGLRGDLALHCLKLDMPFHKTHTPGEMIERIDGDVTAMANFFSQFIFQIVGSALLLLGVLILLWREDWRVGLALTLLAIVAIAVLSRLRDIAVPAEVQESQASAEMYGILEERLGGLEDIRANGGAPYVLRRFFQAQRDLALKERKASILGSSLWVISAAMLALGYALALGLGVYLFRAGTISLGTVFLFFQYTQLLSTPIQRLARQMQGLQEASAGLLRVQELRNTPILLADGKGEGDALPEGPLSIEVDGVSFSYDAEEQVLSDINFQLEAGKVLGLLGRTGSGKTTITRLLLRLYDPSIGSIRVGKRVVRDVALHDLRRHIGIVTQDVELFQASVRDNLTLFDASIPDEHILHMLHNLGLGAWYASLEKGLDSELQPGSVSAGEGQLLAFTRVFLQDPGLVILDEASSRLDPVTEQLIEQAIGRLLHNRTGIIIAHRLQTVQYTDEIMILDGGRIVEHGLREQLASDAHSRFAHLLQVGIEEVLA